MPDRVPKAARDLIAQHIHSVAQLELLIYMHGRGGAPVTAEEAGRDQKIGTEMATSLLADLVARGFAREVDGAFSYQPPDDTAAQVAEVAEAYTKYRVTIINLIFSRPSEGIQGFADAFRVRRDDE